MIGVDEAGRGPLAGPVAVGIVMVPARFNIRKAFPGVADSKKLTAAKREAIYTLLEQKAKESDQVRYMVVFASAKLIDEKGISYAVRQAVARGVRALAPVAARGGRSSVTAGDVRVLLDGLLHAPLQYEQSTIVRGDVSEPVISLASIVAKVRRDRLMSRLATRYPFYGFDVHKGYGTHAHYEAIQKHGTCAIHRRSFGLQMY